MEELPLIFGLKLDLYFIVQLSSRIFSFKTSPLKCTGMNVFGKNTWEVHQDFYRGDCTIVLSYIFIVMDFKN